MPVLYAYSCVKIQSLIVRVLNCVKSSGVHPSHKMCYTVLIKLLSSSAFYWNMNVNHCVH